MTNFARVINNVAVDVSVDPINSFHPDIAAQFVSVPNNVQVGWFKDEDGQWSAPVIPEPIPLPTVYPKVGPIHFQLLFDPIEIVKSVELKETDKIVASFWKLVDDPRTDIVDLNLQSVQNAIEYVLTAVKNAGVDINVQSRKAAILSGILT